jgi:hypothetical protein
VAHIKCRGAFPEHPIPYCSPSPLLVSNGEGAGGEVLPGLTHPAEGGEDALLDGHPVGHLGVA